MYIGDIISWTVKAKNVKGSRLHFPELNIESDSLNVKQKTFLYENDNLEGIEFELVFGTPENSKLLNIKYSYWIARELSKKKLRLYP